MRQLRRTLCLAGLLLSGVAQGAGRTIGDRLERAEADLREVEARVVRLGREYGQRRGLIGAEEALRRYEDGVFTYLVGDYEPAALTFFTLVESEALPDKGMHQDAEWYLAESVFELGNWATALDAYGDIVGAGEQHPFFADAVRRQLEVYGLMGDSEAFYELYRKWILSGRVPATDGVKYTVAKSFYRQGETARAKSMFMEQPVGGPYYGQARYFLGTVLAVEGELGQAVVEYERVISAEAKSSPEVAELARLALGRLHYELGNYDKAVENYQTIASDSPYFADQLYELVWTYIKQEDWDSALRHVEIFLIAFPDHPYTMQMKLNQGHLHMKAKGFEKALASYEIVVGDYSPLQERMVRLEGGVDDPKRFYAALVAAGDGMGAEADGVQLPASAVQLLVGDDAMGRAVAASRALRSQDKDMQAAQSALAEIGSVLSGTDEAIGTFSRGRQSLLRVRDDGLQLRNQLITLEVQHLADTDGLEKAEAQAIREQQDVLAIRAQEVQGVESARTDRYQVHEDQVRAVQEVAGRLRRMIDELDSEATATRRVLAGKRASMSVGDVERVEADLVEVETELKTAKAALEAMGSDATRRQVMASVPRGRADDTDSQRALLAEDYDNLHKGLARYRSGATGDPAPLRQIDEMWSRVNGLDSRSREIRDQLESAESREVALLRDGVTRQVVVVDALASELRDAESGSNLLAGRITRTGFGRLADQLYANIMEADMGIVDVYWLRKTEVVDERTRLATERSERLRELDERFNLIRQKIED